MRFTGVASIGNAKEDSLVFCDHTGVTAEEMIRKTRALNVVTYIENKDFCDMHGKHGIYSCNPRLLFLLLWKKNFPIADRYVVHPSAVVMDNVKLGKNVRIGPGTVIGCDGFNQVRDDDGSLMRVPHVGGVVIGDNVEIQSNCCVSCGTFDDTIIGSGTHVDNLVHIAHNVIIGRNCRITAGVIIAGNVKIGDNCFLGIGCLIRDQVAIGDNVTIGMGSVVIHGVPNKAVVVGNPGRVTRYDL